MSRIIDKIRDSSFSKEGCHITQKEVNAVFDEQVQLCADTLQKKTKEYTGDDTDRLGAFKAAAALQHTTPELSLIHISSDPDTGKAKKRLKFEKEVKSQRAHVKGPVPTRPVKAGANMAVRCV